jgi:hypothetical protein
MSRLEVQMKVRLSSRDLTNDEILSVACPTCKRGIGDWCVSLREANLLLMTLHQERVRRAYRKAQAKDWQKAHKRMKQIRDDTERYNEGQRQLAEWIHGARMYVWLRENGSILWEKNEGE